MLGPELILELLQLDIMNIQKPSNVRKAVTRIDCSPMGRDRNKKKIQEKLILLITIFEHN